MNGDLEGDDMIEGDDDLSGEEANVLGAIMRRMRGRRRGRPMPRQIGTPKLAQRETWKTAKLRSFAGIGSVSWTGAADATDKATTIEPQESFEGRRLIVDTLAAGGVSAGLVQLRRIDVGTMPQSPSVEQAAPVAMFRPDATYAYMDLQIAYRATKLQTTFAITTSPGAGVTVTASGGYFGNWIR